MPATTPPTALRQGRQLAPLTRSDDPDHHPNLTSSFIGEHSPRHTPPLETHPQPEPHLGQGHRDHHLAALPVGEAATEAKLAA